MIILILCIILLIVFVFMFQKQTQIESFENIPTLESVMQEEKSRSNWLTAPTFYKVNNKEVPNQWYRWNVHGGNSGNVTDTVEWIPTPNDKADDSNKSSYGQNDTFDWDIKSGKPSGSVNLQSTGGATNVGGSLNVSKPWSNVSFAESGVIKNNKNNLHIFNPVGSNYQISKEGTIISDTWGGKGDLYVDQKVMTDTINPRKTDHTILNDNVKVHKDLLYSSGEIQTKGAENRKYGDTHFPWKGDNQNYIRGRTNVNGTLHLYDGVNTKGGKSDRNPGNHWTHFPWGGNGKNYIRGDTIIDGHVDLNGNLKAGAFQTYGADIALRDESRASGNTGPRRALVHGPDDELIINYAGDYTSDTRVHGDKLTANKFCIKDSNNCIDENTLQSLGSPTEINTKNAKIDGQLSIGGPIKFTVDNAADNDHYNLKKIQHGSDKHELRLTINDNSDEKLSIYGDSCRTTGCGGIGVKQHEFDAVGKATHKSIDLAGGKIRFLSDNGSDPFEGGDTDPYHLQKIARGNNNSELRLTINDDRNEKFTIWGDSCHQSGGCRGEGAQLFQFGADGYARNKTGLCIGNTCITEGHLKKLL